MWAQTFMNLLKHGQNGHHSIESTLLSQSATVKSKPENGFTKSIWIKKSFVDTRAVLTFEFKGVPAKIR